MSRAQPAVTYLLTGAAVVAVAAVRFALDPLLGDAAPLILFLIPVSLAGWRGGYGPGLMATALGVAAGVLLFPPGRHPAVPHSTAVNLLIRGVPFACVGASISCLAARREAARRQAEASAAVAHAAADAADAARRQAEAASRAKDDFVSILSHELRTPLAPVLAAVDLIGLNAAAGPGELAELVAVVRRNVEAEARLVDDLLDVSRIAHGKVSLCPAAVDADAAVREAVEAVRPDAESKGLSVVVATPPAAGPVYVWADPGRLRQMLANLLNNAVKFTPAGGTVTVRTVAQGEGRLRFEVADTGVGIRPDVLPRLFRPFEQGEQTVTRRFGGLGLGLSIVRSLAELHGGTVTAASDGEGRGSTFTLRLPVARTPRPLSTAGPATVARASRRVLLVEDHDDTRKIMARVLAGLGNEVTAVGTVREAIAAADGRGPFDLLVSDIGLPDGTGLDVMRHVGSTSGTVGIAVSGFGAEEDVRRSRDAGFAMQLIKPVSIQALREAIDAAPARG